MKTKHGLSTGLMIFVAALTSAIWLFGLGYIMCKIGVNDFQDMGLILVLISFPLGIVASFFMVKCSIGINIMTDYGIPVYIAAQHIKEIVKQVNIYGVKNLQGIVEKAMKDELFKVVKKNK